jgi:prolipoprotein diacylglyceryltransferase
MQVFENELDSAVAEVVEVVGLIMITNLFFFELKRCQFLTSGFLSFSGSFRYYIETMSRNNQSGQRHLCSKDQVPRGIRIRIGHK